MDRKIAKYKSKIIKKYGKHVLESLPNDYMTLKRYYVNGGGINEMILDCERKITQGFLGCKANLCDEETIKNNFKNVNTKAKQTYVDMCPDVFKKNFNLVNDDHQMATRLLDEINIDTKDKYDEVAQGCTDKNNIANSVIRMWQNDDLVKNIISDITKCTDSIYEDRFKLYKLINFGLFGHLKDNDFLYNCFEKVLAGNYTYHDYMYILWKMPEDFYNSNKNKHHNDEFFIETTVKTKTFIGGNKIEMSKKQEEVDREIENQFEAKKIGKAVESFKTHEGTTEKLIDKDPIKTILDPEGKLIKYLNPE